MRSPLLALPVLLCFAPAAYFFCLQAHEHSAIDRYLEETGLHGAPLTRETAVRVSQAVRQNFLVDEERFEALNVGHQPFLRASTLELLEAREGLCGEGTRVIINLLTELGFDATRVVLFNRHLESSHTLVSVELDGREFFLDTINSMPEITRLLETEDVSSRHFHVLHYTDDLKERRQLAAEQKTAHTEAMAPFFYHFWLYSYEALPYAKLLTTVGIDVRVFSFQRPFRFISSWAEKPNLIRGLIWLVCPPLALWVIFALGRIVSTRQQTLPVAH